MFVDCIIVKRLLVCGFVIFCIIYFVFGRGINRSRRILWFVYDRGDGRRKLIIIIGVSVSVFFYFCFVNVL